MCVSWSALEASVGCSGPHTESFKRTCIALGVCVCDQRLLGHLGGRQLLLSFRSQCLHGGSCVPCGRCRTTSGASACQLELLCWHLWAVLGSSRSEMWAVFGQPRGFGVKSFCKMSFPRSQTATQQNQTDAGGNRTALRRRRPGIFTAGVRPYSGQQWEMRRKCFSHCRPLYSASNPVALCTAQQCETAFSLGFALPATVGWKT
jgi:hypothetical protein